MTNACQATSTQWGGSCARCRICWDRDDEAPPCPRQCPPVVREPTPAYASGLAPDPFAGGR